MLQTSTRTVGPVIIVDCRGEVVLGDETASLRDQVKDLMMDSKFIVLNMEDVKHIDSNGIGTLFGLHITAEKLGVKLHLAALGKYVKSVSEVTKLTMFIPAYPTVEQAVARFEVAAEPAHAH